MRSFKDSLGRSWEVAVNVFSLARVKDSELKLYLPGLFGEGENGVSGYVAFLGDEMLRAKTLFVLIKPDVPESDFLQALDGDALEAGTMALQEELIDFFPKSRRDPLRRLLAKMQALGEMLAQQAMGRADQMGQKEIDAALASLDAKLKAVFGDSPASLEFTQALSPGDSST